MIIRKNTIQNNFKQLFRYSGINRPKLEGSFVEGTVIGKQKQFLTVYTGWKSTIKFTEKELFLRKHGDVLPQAPIGQRVQLYTYNIENSEGDMILNAQYYADKVKAISAWDRVRKLKYAKGVVLNTVHGGFSVGIAGIVCFLPRSRAKLPKIGKKEYVQYLLDHYCLYKIIKVNTVRRNIVVSLVHISRNVL